MTASPDVPRSGFAAEVDFYASTHEAHGINVQTPIDGLLVLRSTTRTPMTSTMYRPSVCTILQGEKDVRLGEHGTVCGPGDSIIVSHDVPVVTRITRATATEPYLALVVVLDLTVLRELVADLGDDLPRVPRGRGALEVGPTDARMMGALARLFDVATRPREIEVLAPLILREIHYRLLQASDASALVELASRDTRESRVAAAIALIRDDLTRSHPVADLARASSMSPSSFHQQFKAVTSMTPLQYQKELRLLAAQRLLAEERRSVAEAASEVGYLSASQFSREYSRKFGRPPSSDRRSSVAA
jgi:AraC-like DNA-binding protein